VRVRWEEGVYADGSELFISNLCPTLGDEISISIRVYSDSGIESVLLSTLVNGEERVFPMNYAHSKHAFDYYTVQIKIINNITKYHYKLIKDGIVWCYNQRGIESHSPLKIWDFTIIADGAFPKWVKEAVFYQIFPDRFYNGNPSNDIVEGEYELDGYKATKKNWTDTPPLYWENGNVDFFGGDLEGIEQKIGYLLELGVNAIYLNPIFTAYSNHKYDCIDYFHVDKHFGGDEALIRLIEVLHKNEMRIVLDISINHVGKKHPWCNEHPEFFFYDETGQMEGWNGIVDLLVLNFNSEKLKEIVYIEDSSALKKRLMPPFNADGWRFDVGQSTGVMKESKLDMSLWREIRNEIKSIKPEAYLFAEHWDDCTMYLQGDMWDASMNYYGFTRAVRKFLGDADRFLDYKTNNSRLISGAKILKREVMEQYSLIPYSIWSNLFNLISSHDYPRIGMVLPKEATMLSVMFLFVFPGVPCVYYGDEVGLKGYLEQDSGFRFPMEWNKERQDLEIYDLYRFLISYRRRMEVLKQGSFRFVYADADIIGIARFDEDKCVLFICAATKTQARCQIALDSIGIYECCVLVREVGNCHWSFDSNTVSVLFDNVTGLLLELSGE